MEGGDSSSFVREINLDRLTTEKDYLWQCLANICKDGSAKDFCDLISTLHNENNMDLISLFNIVKIRKNGETLIQICARSGNVALMEFFVKNGVSVDQDNGQGWTALHEACLHNQTQVAKFLLESGAKADCCDVNYKTPLAAATEPSPKLLDIFKPYIKHKDEGTPLSKASLPSIFHTACRYGDLAMVGKVLLDSLEDSLWSVDYPYYNETPLKCATRYNQLEVVKHLVVEAKCSIDDEESSSNDTVVHLASILGHLQILKFFHEKGGDIYRRGKIIVQYFRRRKFETGGKTPLHYACQHNRLPIVQYLLSKCAESSIQDLEGDTPLHIACRNGHVKIVEELTKGHEITVLKNNSGDTAFDVTEDPQILDILKNAGVQINQLDRAGSSPLHRCAEDPQLLPKLKWLIESGGATVKQTNNDLMTPLHEACYKGNVPAIEFLLGRGASVNARDASGATPLHSACACTGVPVVETSRAARMMLQFNSSLPARVDPASRSSSQVKDATLMLLEHGADIDAQDVRLETPLCRASKVGNMSVVELLIKRGARINSFTPTNHLDWTSDELLKLGGMPLHNACINGFPEIVRLLLDHGAEFTKPGGAHGNIPIIYALNFARDDHSSKHFEILKLLVQVGGHIDTTKTEQLCAFLATCRSKAPQNIHARTIVEMVLPTRSNQDNDISEKSAHFIPNIVKYLLQQNVLLPSTCTESTAGESRVSDLSDMFNRHLKVSPILTTKLLIAADFFTPCIARAMTNEVYNDNEDMKCLRDEVLSRVNQVPTLFHTCRTYLRRTLGSQLEHKLMQLPLPERIKSYLMFQELDEILDSAL